MAEGARFENTPAAETIGRDLLALVEFQSLVEESEEGEMPIKPDAAR